METKTGNRGAVTVNIYLLAVMLVLFAWGCIATGIAIGRGEHYATNAQRSATSYSGAFQVGKAVPSGALLALSGRQGALRLGRRATVVVFIATWCKYCAYMDKWIVPQISKLHGIQVDVVDISSEGGIADPGPRTPVFSGSDAQKEPLLSLRGMESDLRTYVADYRLNGSDASFFVAPSSTQTKWRISALPTVVVLNTHGTVSVAHPGAMTIGQLSAAVTSRR